MHCSCNDEDRGGRKSNLTVAGSAFMGADYRVGHFSVLDTGQFGDIVVNTLSPGRVGPWSKIKKSSEIFSCATGLYKKG